jgi:hypothetical protein
VNALRRYKGKRFNIGSLLRDCREHYVDGDQLVLVFGHKAHFERFKSEMEDPRCRSAVEEAFAEAMGEKREVRVTLEENNAGNNSLASRSSMVRAALGLGARIVEEKEDDE